VGYSGSYEGIKGMSEINTQLSQMFSRLSIMTRDIHELEARKRRLEDFVEWLDQNYDWNLPINKPGVQEIRERLDLLEADRKAAEMLKPTSE
jgi:hypothetical protein